MITTKKERDIVHDLIRELDRTIEFLGACDHSVNIRKLYIQGICQKKLASMFGVCNTIISRVVNRRIWSHI